MNKEIKDILNELKNSIKKPATTEIDNFTEEEYEYPNFFVLDPTTNECKALYNYITNLQKENQKYRETIDKAIEYIEKLNKIIPRFWFAKLLELLKEVE